jgi:hypothetical protein
MRLPIGGGSAAAGAVAGLLGAGQGPRFRDYTLREHRSAFRYDDRLVPGARLPLSGVNYYAAPREYGVVSDRQRGGNSSSSMIVL